MKTPTKIALTLLVGLIVFGLAASLVAGDTKVARWIYDDGGRTSEALLKRAASAWNLDVKSYKYAGVRSTKGWVIVHQWEHSNGHQTELVYVTSVEGLVCHARRNNDSGQLQNIGCHQY